VKKNSEQNKKGNNPVPFGLGYCFVDSRCGSEFIAARPASGGFDGTERLRKLPFLSGKCNDA
jgi:hypothetical protein